METHDHQSSSDAAGLHEPSAAPTENKAAQTHPTAPESTGSATQAAPADTARPASQTQSIDPSDRTEIPDHKGPTVSQFTQGQAAGQQAAFQPNVFMDPGTGQLYYAIPQGQFVQPPSQNGQYVYYTTQAPPEQPPSPHQPDYAQIMKSVEDFTEGDASVADVVKTLWTETSQDDQFWKGAVVGAAATFLLTSQTVRGAMGKTFGSLFGKHAKDAAAASPSPAPDGGPTT